MKEAGWSVLTFLNFSGSQRKRIETKVLRRYSHAESRAIWPGFGRAVRQQFLAGWLKTGLPLSEACDHIQQFSRLTDEFLLRAPSWQ